ncbi:hypothetical protein D3C81_1943050 [compost metagenome]
MKFFMMPTCCSPPLVSAGTSHFQASGRPKGAVLVLLNSRSDTRLRWKVITFFSTTILPMSPEISRRLVPGDSAVEVIYTPLAPFSNSM